MMVSMWEVGHNQLQMFNLITTIGLAMLILQARRARLIICNRLILTDTNTDCQNFKSIPIIFSS